MGNSHEPPAIDLPRGSRGLPKTPVTRSKFMEEDNTYSTNGKIMGRPSLNRLPGKGMTLAAYAREHGANVIDVLADILNTETNRPSDRIAAGSILLDRGFGKAVSVIGDEDGNPVNLAQVLIGVIRTEVSPGDDEDFGQVIDHAPPAEPEAPLLPDDLDPDA